MTPSSSSRVDLKLKCRFTGQEEDYAIKMKEMLAAWPTVCSVCRQRRSADVNQTAEMRGTAEIHGQEHP
jgi:hypothetical protein